MVSHQGHRRCLFKLYVLFLAIQGGSKSVILEYTRMTRMTRLGLSSVRVRSGREQVDITTLRTNNKTFRPFSKAERGDGER